MSPGERVALHAQLACIWEATARKPGNVHRLADFDDTSYVDFLSSAAAIAPVLARAASQGVGQSVLEAVRRTRLVAPSNTNLGIILLFAPLARAACLAGEKAGSAEASSFLGSVLASLTVEDCRLTYEAIRRASPGGLGQVAEQDVSGEPTVTLLEAMALAAARDLVARQYSNGFREVFEGVKALERGLRGSGSLEGAIVYAHLCLLAHHPDTLIARKCGEETAREAATKAREVLEGRGSLADLDSWLRAEGRRRNPGTTADLIAASLFVALEEGVLSPSLRFGPPVRLLDFSPLS